MSGPLGNWLPAHCRCRNILLGAAALLGLYATSKHNYLLFHGVVEIVGVVVACAVFLLFWNARRFLSNGFFLFLGIACLFTGILDLLHVLCQDGMSILPGFGENQSLQVKTAGRLMASLSFVMAPMLLRRKIDVTAGVVCYGAATAIVVYSIFYWGMLPACFVRGVGTTLVEQVGRGASGLLFLLAIAVLARHRKAFETGVFRLLVGALLASSASEFASAAASDPQGILMVAGHLLQVVSYYFLYKAFIEVGLTKPHELLFRSWKEAEDALQNERHFLQTVIDSVQDGIMVCDADGALALVNRTARELHNLPVEAIASGPTSLSPNAFYPSLYQADGKTPLAKADSPLDRALGGEYVHNVEVTLRPEGGPARTVLVSGRPLAGKNSEKAGAVIAVRDITARKQAEETLCDREEKLSRIVQNSAEVIFSMSRRGIVNFVSPAWTAKLGWEVADLEGKRFRNFVHPDDAVACRNGLRQVFRTGRQQPGIECRVRHKDGGWRWFATTLAVVRDKSGKPVACVGVAEDVTQRKSAQEMQARLLRRLEGVNRLQEDLILPGCLEEKLKKITEAAVDLLGLDFCRIWRTKPGDLCNTGCTHAQAVEEVHRCPRRDKCLHLVASSGRYTGTDGTHRRVPLGCYKIGRVAAGEHKRFLTNSVTTDPHVADHAWAQRLGLASFAGYKLHDAKGDPIGVLAMFAQHPLSEEDDAFLTHLAETTSKVILDSLVDEELRQSQKMEAVGSLAGGIAHEFNNLLQAIGGYAACAMEGLPAEEQRHDDLRKVLKATSRASMLTRQLLGFSRRHAPQRQAVDSNGLVADLVKMFHPLMGEHIELEMDLGNDVGAVYADPGELQQVLLNLCLNARDAMPSGGKLVIRTERVVLDKTCWEHHFQTSPGTYGVFTVADTGCGMPADVCRRAFEPFFTTKEVGKGTGLGLAMVYGIVRQHQGAVHLSSVPRRGSTFKVYIPIASQDTHDLAPVQPPSLLRGTETILLAEDEPMVRGLAVRILRQAGYTVLPASDGEEAVRLFDKHAATISLVVLDVIMPKLGGQEVYRHIMARHPEVNVIFCTAYGLGTSHAEFILQDNLRLIEKPFDPQTMLHTIRDVLGEQKAGLLVS